ncbi:carbohydrate esterase family 16 protein [Hypoxylon argillaceum]|nr:carbohydrate esterase family 16 protein [Hypoxylon argillaceum]
MLSHALLLSGFAIGISSGAQSAIKNLIVFGDSYTDAGRLAYFINNGEAPPPGTVIPIANVTAGGSYGWPYYASQKLGATIYDYAVSGAACSNDIINRYFDLINGTFPSVIDYEVPAFKADLAYASAHPKSPLFPHRTAENSIYALWIGTNDLGEGGFLLDKQRPGKTISDYVDCVWAAFDGIYATGGRQFALFTQAPLELSPAYKAVEHGGAGDNGVWPNKTAYDTLEYEEKIREYTTNVNTMYDYGVPFQLLVEQRWPGASFMIFDTHQILLDIYNSPEKYLSAPANVTGTYYTCPDPNSGDGCADSEYPLSSFLWYDTLHPSSQADKIIGTEFAKALYGKSPYTTYYSS